VSESGRGTQAARRSASASPTISRAWPLPARAGC